MKKQIIGVIAFGALATTALAGNTFVLSQQQPAHNVTARQEEPQQPVNTDSWLKLPCPEGTAFYTCPEQDGSTNCFVIKRRWFCRNNHWGRVQ